jgi:solute carrier family 10 (sodium/bile acid cotransporter), member 7
MNTKSLTRAWKRPVFNACIQIFCLGVDSAIAFGIITRGLLEWGVVSETLAQGIVACTCLPMSMGSVMSLTKAAGGDVGSARVNSTLSNFLGIFTSPILMILFMGTTTRLGEDIVTLAYRLTLRIIAPLLVGLLVQAAVRECAELRKVHKKRMAKLQIYAIFFTVYTVFCQAFAEPQHMNVTVLDILAMILSQIGLFVIFLLFTWGTFCLVVPGQPQLRVMALFGCTQKTVCVPCASVNT